MATVVSMSYETGTAGPVSSTNPPAGGSDLAATLIAAAGSAYGNVITTDAAEGTKCGDYGSTAAGTSSVYHLKSGLAATQMSGSAKVKIVSTPTGDVIFFRSFNDVAARWLTLLVSSANKIVARVTNSDTTLYTSAALTVGKWYRVVWMCSFSATAANLTFRVYDGNSTTAIDAGYSTTAGNTGTGANMADARWGLVNTAVASAIRLDAVRVDTGTLAEIPPPVTLPVVTVGPDQIDQEPGVPVNLAASATGATGGSWSLVSSTATVAPTLNDATSLAPSYTSAGKWAAACTDVWRYTATNGSGSASKDVSITFRPNTNGYRRGGVIRPAIVRRWSAP